jgi:hypothetical protein
MVGAVAAALIVTACSSGKKAALPTTSTSTTAFVTTTTAAPMPAPLTGLPQPDQDKLRRPALTVKIENSPDARPQAGLDAADVVYEEMVEGGITRFLAVFQSNDADPVGPIRSVRPVDPNLVTPIGGLFAYSGGIPAFVARMRAAPVTLVGFDEFEKAYVHRKGKRAPHNVYSSTGALYAGRKKGDKGDVAPQPLFQYLTAGATFAPTAPPATHAEVTFPGNDRVTWDFDATASLWRRGEYGTPHLLESGGQVSFPNLIMQVVPYHNTGSRDPAGNPVPEADVIGSGDATVLVAGRQVKARWTKTSAAAVPTYTDASGAAILLSPGPTWVMLVPSGTQIVLR